MGKRFCTIVLCTVLAAACSKGTPTGPSKNPTAVPPHSGDPRGATTNSTANFGEPLCQWAPSGVSCDVVDQTATYVTVRFTNSGTDPVAINLSVYERHPPDSLESQVFFAAGSGRLEVLNSGQQATLTATFPNCLFQVDAYIGAQVSNPPHPPERMLGFMHGGTGTCGVVEDPPVPDEGLEGCTPGFWKNHEAAWPAPYTPTTQVNSVFSAAPGGITLMAALNFKGGPDSIDKSQILLRAAVAALLNIANSDVDYPLTLAQLVFYVNEALNGDNELKLSVADALDQMNNLGCPINGKGGVVGDRR